MKRVRQGQYFHFSDFHILEPATEQMHWQFYSDSARVQQIIFNYYFEETAAYSHPLHLQV